MKRYSFLSAIGLLALILVLPTSSVEAKDNTEAEQAIIKLEHELSHAYVKDVAALEKILADDWVFIGAEGEVRTKSQEIGDLKSGALKLTALSAEDMKVRVYGKSAVVTGIYEVKGTQGGKDIGGRFRFTDVLVRKKDVWRLVSTHASQAPAKK